METQLPLVFHIEQTDRGYTAIFNSPDQEAEGIPFSQIAYDEPGLKLETANIRATYMGKISSNFISGIWNLGGQALPLNLSKKEVESFLKTMVPEGTRTDVLPIPIPGLHFMW